jgi:hypothetical protein
MKYGLDLILEYPNAFTDEICDEMVRRFESDDRKVSGISGIYGPNYTGPTSKVSTDLGISKLKDWVDMDDRIFDILSPYVSEYVKILREQFYYEELENIKDLGYQIQRTDPSGFFSWHCDHDIQPLVDQLIRHDDGDALICSRERIVTFILYLNDRLEYSNDDGTTEFKFGEDNKFIKAEKGKLIMFPASTFYPHRGVPLKNGVKYLMTGWVTRDRVCQVTQDPDDYEDRRLRYSGGGPNDFMNVEGRATWTTGT